ncbi:hypothetical protein JAAARDRAFT_59084 [Jaapia argillacea MUCL 33604]|uniref:MARVEL domain-containing protein n=1 Tax=Jaapia argillacea MUCL 33604 TaxID=933084 RepID=A0A067PSQ5_9AGAM|nr:hypothetical protein JAAARDRAFT_59084 [Jaapia argillacea MUCL 33604]
MSNAALVQEYTATFGGLVTISLFGAAIAWSAVFNAVRGDLLLFSWANCCFVSAGVAATGIGIILRTNGIHLTKDKQNSDGRWFRAHNILRGFAVVSACLVLAGLLIMSVAVINLPQDASGTNSWTGLDTDWREAANIAAGATTIGLSVTFIAIALVTWAWNI